MRDDLYTIYLLPIRIAVDLFIDDHERGKKKRGRSASGFAFDFQKRDVFRTQNAKLFSIEPRNTVFISISYNYYKKKKMTLVATTHRLHRRNAKFNEAAERRI